MQKSTTLPVDIWSTGELVNLDIIAKENIAVGQVGKIRKSAFLHDEMSQVSDRVLASNYITVRTSPARYFCLARMIS